VCVCVCVCAPCVCGCVHVSAVQSDIPHIVLSQGTTEKQLFRLFALNKVENNAWMVWENKVSADDLC